MTKTKRLEARVDEVTADLLSQAAALREESVSAFVVRSARAEAESVLARHDRTVMPSGQFDAMIAALEEPTAPVAELVALARKPRRFGRA